ncbi:MAG TPA: peptidylprolyl isomerase [Ilumatobacteraceae bacterium]|jgi:peptidylprolyl isomerase
MKRLLAALGVGCAAALAVAAPAFAYTPPETNPRIVVTTSEGTILIALAPENAPKHVEQLLLALDDHDFIGASAARVAPDFYVQMVGRQGRAQLAGLTNEHEKAGNVRGAVSVYDSGKAGDVPTLMFVLVSSPQLDSDYTMIGVVEAGMSVLKKMATIPTAGDHQPTKAITISEIHFASAEERAKLRQAEVTPGPTEGTSLLAAVFILAFAAFIAAAISAFRDKLRKPWVTSMWLMVALLTFFAVWVAIGASGHGTSVVGIAMFGGAIAMFRLMGRFERPAQAVESGRSAEPVELTDRELDSEGRVDQTQGQLELSFGQRDTPAGRL